MLNGSIPCRFWFDEYIAYKYYADDNTYFVKRPQDFGYRADEVLKRLCLTRDELHTYGKGKDLYAIHIKKLEIFDKPMELGEFYRDWDRFDTDSNGKEVGWYDIGINPLTKAPQSYQYVYVNEVEE